MAMLWPLWSEPLSAGEDDVVYYYPLRQMVASQVRQGSWPLHNSLEAGGVPLMADPQTALLHPTTWLFVAAPGKTAYALSLFAAFAAAGGGAYVYLRRLGLLPAGAIVGAIAMMFCGFMVGHRVHLSIVLAAAMLPWGLACIEAMRRDRARPLRWPAAAGALAIVVFLALAAGHWPTFIHLCIIWGVYLLLRGRPLLKTLSAAGAAVAVAMLLAGPQLYLTMNLLTATTRQKIGYAMAAENSFFPPAAVLAVFPHFMGSRTPNFFDQPWWGPWHLCEMLGYVGLLTLALAGAAAWRLTRKAPPAEDRAYFEERVAPLRPVARAWLWIIAGAFVFMLGGYIPPLFKLVHMTPVLGDVVRCPARMVLAVDMGLCALAAMGVHAIMVSPRRGAFGALVRRSAVRWCSAVLPAAMAGALALFAVAGAVLHASYPTRVPLFDGGAQDMLAAARLTNPAVWVQVVLLVVSLAALLWWLRRPRRRAWALSAVLLADLYFVTAFVDVPAGANPPPDGDRSPAAGWLSQNAPECGYRVWGLGLPRADGQLSYNARADELLLPKSCQALGVATIGNYGPFQSARHAQLGFRIWGANRDWAALLRGNHLLSLYGVKYVLSADPRQWTIIESVRVSGEAAAPDGDQLLWGDWTLSNGAQRDGEELTFRSDWQWKLATAARQAPLEAGLWYCISLDARAPAGAANYLRAELHWDARRAIWDDPSSLALHVEAEQLSPQWRHFEWRFQAPPDAPEAATLYVTSSSERPITVRNVSLRVSSPQRPLNIGSRLEPGESVYRRAATLPPRRPGDTPVVIYENLLWRPAPQAPPPVGPEASALASAELEELKWRPPDLLAGQTLVVPSLGIASSPDPGPMFWRTSVPGALALAALGAVALVWRRRE